MAKFMLGNYRHSLDEKNRFRIPVKFREGLGANPYYMPGKNGCLYIVPEERFEEMFAPFINQNPYTSDTDEFTSSVFAFSGPLEEDAQGRVALDKTSKRNTAFQKSLFSWVKRPTSKCGRAKLGTRDTACSILKN